MAVEKANLNVNFASGLDTKTDPWQVSPGRFLRLVNSQFDKGGQLQKRNGFGELTELTETATFLTTFNGNLTAIGSSLQAYVAGSNTWVDKGTVQPCELTTLPLLRNGLTQSQCDAALAPNGLVCITYTSTGTPLNTSALPPATYSYAIVDSTTGQNVVTPTLLTATAGSVAGSPRVFVVGNHFIIVYPTLVVSTYHLQFTAIAINSPTQVTGPTDISSQYQPATQGTLAFDGVVANSALYLAWNGTDLGDALRVTYIDSGLTIHSTAVFASVESTVLTLAADTTGATASIYIVSFDAATNAANLTVVSATNQQILAPTSITLDDDISNLTAVAANGRCTVFAEVVGNVGYDITIQRDTIQSYAFDIAGASQGASAFAIGTGLASKAFILDGVAYLLASYSSTLQPSYFLMGMPSTGNTYGYVVAKLAYQNGAGYMTKGLPGVSVSGSVVSISYLIKDLVQAVNKTQGAAVSSGVYSSLGINLATFTIGTESVASAEIGGNLQLSGGFMWAYDGSVAVESGFFLYPEDLKLTGAASSVDTTVDRVSGSPVLTSVNTSSLAIGMKAVGTGIPANALITDINTAAGTVTLDKNASSSGTGGTVTFTGSVADQKYFYVAVYEWADNQGNIVRSAPSIPTTITTSGDTFVTIDLPTLNLTYKHNVSIVLYRWSTAQQTYYQITSITNPLLNDPTLTSVEYIDVKSDSQIIGNNILYTTGGILENIAPSAIDTIALFQSRLFYVESENKNTLGFSQLVIPNTPVECSDVLTLFVAPTTAAQVNTGPIKVLAPMDDKLILWKKDAIYYINGTGPDATGANGQYSEPTFITSTVGCENQRSLVFIPSGLMFESDKGIWLLGRDLSTKYIGADVEEYTQSASVLSAVNVPGTNQVRFTLDSGITLMYDYYYNQWSTFEGISAISSTLYEGKHTFLNYLGQVFQETPGLYVDGSRPVLMSFTTSWLNLAGLQGFERAYFFYLLGKYLSPHKLTVAIGYDYNDSPSQSTVITPDNYNPTYGYQTGPYGSGSPYGGNANVEQWRIFFQTQKCQAFQLTITESFDSSYGTAAGAGLTLSGLDVVVGVKGNYPRLKAARSVG